MYKEVEGSYDDTYGDVKGGGAEGKEEEKGEPEAGEEKVGGEVGEEVVFQSHLEALIAFCGGDRFQASLEAFKRKHVRGNVWRCMAESKDPEKEEQPLEFTDVFREYTELIESALEKFAGVHGIEAHELYYQARDAMDGSFTILFEEHEHKWFVELLLEWMDYDYFVKMMLDATRALCY